MCIQCVVGIHHRSRQATPGVLPPLCSMFRVISHWRPTVAQLAEDADDTLFSSVTRSSNHFLHVLLPEHTNHPYHLRSRTHCFFKLSAQHDNRNFIDRMLFRWAYSVSVWLLSWLYFIHLTAVPVLFFTSCYCVFLCFFTFIYSCVLSSVFYTTNEWKVLVLLAITIHCNYVYVMMCCGVRDACNLRSAVPNNGVQTLTLTQA